MARQIIDASDTLPSSLRISRASTSRASMMVCVSDCFTPATM